MQEFVQLATQLHRELTSLEELADVTISLQEHLQQWGASEDVQMDLRLCVVEAVQNALLHGGAEGCAPVARLAWQCDASGFTFTVADNGLGIPLERQVAEYQETLKESGRGLLLMRAILDEVTFNETGNAVTGILRW